LVIANDIELLEMSDSVLALFEKRPKKLLIVFCPEMVDVAKLESESATRKALNCTFDTTDIGKKNADAVEVPMAPKVWEPVDAGNCCA
jgi:hypothetical protein